MNDTIKSKFESFNRYYFDHNTAQEFIKYLMAQAKVIAPHKKGTVSYVYKEVMNEADVVFDYPRTMHSIKKIFMPPRETLLSFNIKTNDFRKVELKKEKKIFFGIHSYEMQAVKRLDYNFSAGNPESNYLIRREDSIFIGIAFTPDKWHFSQSVGIEVEDVDGFAIYFYPTENGYLVFEITPEGGKLLKGFGKGTKVNGQPFNMPEKIFKTKIKYHHNRIPQVFDYVYKSKVWDEVAERCVGCGTCNTLCSTCFCFDVRDEIELNVTDGSRERFWDSCMLNQFAEVAGGENFREKLGHRTRHRLYRKFKYITDQSGDIQCVGCGRCSRYCPADISMVNIVNDLIDDYSDQQKKHAI